MKSKERNKTIAQKKNQKYSEIVTAAVAGGITDRMNWGVSKGKGDVCFQVLLILEVVLCLMIRRDVYETHHYWSTKIKELSPDSKQLKPMLYIEKYWPIIAIPAFEPIFAAVYRIRNI